MYLSASRRTSSEKTKYFWKYQFSGSIGKEAGAPFIARTGYLLGGKLKKWTKGRFDGEWQQKYNIFYRGMGTLFIEPR